MLATYGEFESGYRVPKQLSSWITQVVEFRLTKENVKENDLSKFCPLFISNCTGLYKFLYYSRIFETKKWQISNVVIEIISS